MEVVNYKYANSERIVVHCISEDGKSYCSLLVGEGFASDDIRYREYQQWVEAGGKVEAEDYTAPPEKPRDFASEIDELKAQIAAINGAK